MLEENNLSFNAERRFPFPANIQGEASKDTITPIRLGVGDVH